MSIYSEDHKNYLKNLKRKTILVHITQITIIILLFSLWELLAKLDIINTFLYISPSKIINTVINYLSHLLFLFQYH